MDVRTGSKSWGYSKRPRNWEKIMYRDLPDEPDVEEVEEVEEIDEIEEVEEVEEVEKIPEIPEIEEVEEIEEKPKIEKPKITARVSKPVPRPLVDPALLDSSFSHI